MNKQELKTRLIQAGIKVINDRVKMADLVAIGQFDYKLGSKMAKVREIYEKGGITVEPAWYRWAAIFSAPNARLSDLESLRKLMDGLIVTEIKQNHNKDGYFFTAGGTGKAVAGGLISVPLDVVRHLEDSDAQTPDADEAAEMDWKFGQVKLSDIELNPSHSVQFRADDPELLDKVRKSFEGPEDSIAHARKLAKAEGLPPIVLGGSSPYYVMDGFHRILAAYLRGEKTIEAYVGTHK